VTLQQRYPQPPATVFALLTDADFITRRCARAGDRDVVVQRDEDGDELRLTVTRVASNLPRLAHTFLPAACRVEERVRWRREAGGFTAAYQVRLASGKVEIRGTVTLVPEGSGCTHEEEVEATVHLPLLGHKLGALVTREVARAVESEMAFAAQELIDRS
jgi:uncharacterized protein YndB with AHSA1/START domain